MQGTTSYESVAQGSAGDSYVLMASPPTQSETSRRVQGDLNSFARGDSSGTVQGDLGGSVPGDGGRRILQPLQFGSAVSGHVGVAQGSGLLIPHFPQFEAAPSSSAVASLALKNLFSFSDYSSCS